MQLNQLTIYGHLTRDPEPVETASGVAIARFSIGCNEPPRAGREEGEVSFFEVTAFGKTAEAVLEYMAKGKPVVVEGRLKQERWVSEDGTKRSAVKIIANRVHFLPKGKDEQQQQKAKPQAKPEVDYADDDIPF